MILICCSSADTLAAKLYVHLREKSCNVRLLDDSPERAHWGFNWSADKPENESFIILDSQAIPLSDISGVFWRTFNPIGRPKQHLAEADPNQSYMDYEVLATLQGLLHSIRRRVINPIIPGRWNHSIFLHVDGEKWIARCGFKCVPSTVASTHETLLEACQHIDSRALLGSLDGSFAPRLIKRGEGADVVDKVFIGHSIRPCYLRMLPQGKLIYVYTVNGKIFCSSWTNDAAGGNHWQEPNMAEILPPDLESSCQALAQGLNLTFSQIGLVQGQDGKWYCFDVSGHPSLLGLDEAMQQAILQALSECLISDREALQ